MKTSNRFFAVHNFSCLQRQAGVDPEVADLLCAYARILTDSGRPLVFYNENASLEELSRSFIHRWLLEKNPDVDPRVMSFLTAYGNSMCARNLPIIYTVPHLANKLRISEKRLGWLAHNQRKFYREFSIPKAKGEDRIILAPQERLLTFQKWIQRRILIHGKPHKYATGFIRGRSILSNARPHVGRKVVVRIDLKNFFPSITHRQVRKVFEDFGYPYKVAVLLANLCTVDGRMPQGAPTSPALSNLVCKRLDRRFVGLKKKLKFRYSRYADDIIFSSNNENLPSLIPFFKEILQEEGFEANEEKVKVMRRGYRQIVTGVVINQKPNLLRHQVRKIRAALHRRRTQGAQAVQIASRRKGTHDPLNVLHGHISFCKMINPSKGSEFARQFVG